MTAHMDGITNPPIDELLDKAGSKYSLVLYAAKRARQINAYYSQLGEGLLEHHRIAIDQHRLPSELTDSEAELIQHFTVFAGGLHVGHEPPVRARHQALPHRIEHGHRHPGGQVDVDAVRRTGPSGR